MTGQRWQVGLAGALALVGVGLVFANSTLLAAAVVPLTYVCYGLLSRRSADTQLAVSRTLDPTRAVPGERVTVTLTIENTGRTVLPDVRVADGVPDLLVVEGSPRAGTTLTPGETVTVTYTVVARRGTHEFEPPQVRLRSLAASSVTTKRPSVDGETTLTCRNPDREPVAESTLGRAGQRSTDETGESSEFYATREYRRGDPMRRIDWRHVAKTGEFVTVQYRDQQVARTALVIDVREPTRVRSAAGHPSAATLTADIAERIHATIERSGTLAGVGVVGLERSDPVVDAAGTAWTDGSIRGDSEEPSTLLDAAKTAAGSAGPDTESSGPEQTTAPASTGPDVARADGQGPTDRTAHLLERLPADTQVVLCTPLLDDWPLEFARRLTAHGHDLVVVSPDATRGDSPETRLEAVRRQVRRRRLAGLAETVDWRPGEATDSHRGVR